MNKAVAIPKELSRNGDLIVIPRSDYEEFLQLKKIIPLVELTLSERKAIKEAKKEIKQGKYSTLNQLKDELGD